LTTTLNAALVTAHFQGLSGLAPGAAYHFRVKSKNASGYLATSGDFSFTTGAAPDTTPPVISAVSSSSVSGASATVTWTTNEESDSQVEYGASAAYGSSTALNAAPVTSHSQGLTGLGAGVTYHFRVKSRDAAGNLATSGDFTFTTTAGATTPVISGVSTTGITGTSATVRWNTNAVTDSLVQYGTGTGYGSTTALDSSLTTTHSQSLSGLTAGTTCHFRVKSKDAAGNLATSADYQFMTTSPLDLDLVAGYAFDEGSGTTTADYSGNSNTGILFNMSWTKGKYGSALRFNGTDGYVTAPGTGLPAMNAPQTIAFWFNTSARTTSTQPVVSLVDEGLHISIQPGFKESQIGVWQNPGNWLVAAVPPSTNLWHHIAHTYDGQTHRLYVDGKQVGNSTIAPTAATPTGLQIGRMIDGSGYFKGSLDELRIYRRALTQADIRSLMLQSFVGVRQTCCGPLRTP
jgi:hypothetical protein